MVEVIGSNATGEELFEPGTVRSGEHAGRPVVVATIGVHRDDVPRGDDAMVLATSRDSNVCPRRTVWGRDVDSLASQRVGCLVVDVLHSCQDGLDA
jgi:hypothetical protein